MAAHRKYKWEDWLHKPITILTRGVDYTCPQSTMANLVRNAASRAKVRVSIIDTGVAIIIKVPSAIPHTDQAPVAGQPVAHALAPAG